MRAFHRAISVAARSPQDRVMKRFVVEIEELRECKYIPLLLPYCFDISESRVTSAV